MISKKFNSSLISKDKELEKITGGYVGTNDSAGKDFIMSTSCPSEGSGTFQDICAGDALIGKQKISNL